MIVKISPKNHIIKNVQDNPRELPVLMQVIACGNPQNANNSAPIIPDNSSILFQAYNVNIIFVEKVFVPHFKFLLLAMQ